MTNINDDGGKITVRRTLVPLSLFSMKSLKTSKLERSTSFCNIDVPASMFHYVLLPDICLN